ncbi:MAG: enoyl-CoA hydratase/isomerase family protein [Parachlamydiaceae bacterium]|nr:enoyl-CoA hydratase/isomerase family protein [Parachlamydiaceae bacterium]
MSNAFKLNVDKEGIANIIFDLPGEKINKLSMETMKEFDEMLDQVAANKEIKALIISSGKPDIFIAGADLRSFEPIFKDPTKGREIIVNGHRIFNKLSALPIPSFAFINGACLGGGMELALACTYRLVSDNPKSVMGLPEVSLGIIPGWGGTQRMPRLVGLTEGLALILSGKPIKAQKALKINLVDAIAPADFFEVKSKAFVQNVLTNDGKKQIEKKRTSSSWKKNLVEKNPLGRTFLFRMAEKDVIKKTKGHYPAPLVALKLIQESFHLPLQEGLNKEIEAFTGNLSKDFINAPHLIHLFFVNEALKKDKDLLGDATPTKINAAGVVGAGTMGSGIAWLLSNQEIPVRLKDIDWTAIGKGYSTANAIYSKLVKDKRMKASEASLKFHRLSGTIDYSGFQQVDLVIEAAVESLNLKHQILKELEKNIPKDAVIGTNTSSLTIAEMCSVMEHPERFVGMHFFNPPNKMPLVEIVAGEKSSPKAIATAVDICRKLGKTPIVVKDCPGFLVNRIFVRGANEVILMFQEGTDFKKLETMMLDFGMPMSPFVLADEVGNDVGYKVSKIFHEAYGDRMVVPKLIELMNEHKLYGKKSGKGFYLYEGEVRKERNPEVNNLKQSLNIKESPTPDTDLSDRVMFSMINEAAQCLDEKIIENPAYLDMALIMGIGFPPFRGGLLRYADQVGIDKVVERLKHFENVYGSRFAPCNKLIEMQREKKNFFN